MAAETAWGTIAGRNAGVAWELHFDYRSEHDYGSAVETLVADRVASRIAARDADLWGPEAAAEADKRLAWVGLAVESRALVAEITALKQQLNAAGLDHVVLCGMGGSSLAPEVICASHGAPLTVLDSSDPDYVRRTIEDRLERTIVVVSSKSGSTVETVSQRAAYEEALTAAGCDPKDHLVIVTDAGSPLDESARADGYRVFNADPEVGGRYSALTAFGLVPSGLAGADIGRLLDEAAAIQPALEADSADNPGVRLGALLGVANHAGVDKAVIADNDSGLHGFGDWAEQLIAESTGKQGHGILPVVVPGVDSPNFEPSTSDEVLITLGPLADVAPASGWGVQVGAPLGAAMLLWEYAVAVAGRIIGINPFDQPDVESAKQAARDMLGGSATVPEPAFTDGPVAVFATDGLLDGQATVAGAVAALLSQLEATGDHSYLAVMAYLNRATDADLHALRDRLAARTGRPTTFGWGPRFLHSTGQYHKGGAPTGVFLQITDEPREDLAIPGESFTFGDFIHAQAVGDSSVLAAHGRPVLRLHLLERGPGLDVVRKVLG